MTVHVIERIADDDRWAYYCTCGAFLAYSYARAVDRLCDHLEHEVVPDPLAELALIEAKQRHPSRRRLA